MKSSLELQYGLYKPDHPQAYLLGKVILICGLPCEVIKGTGFKSKYITNRIIYDRNNLKEGSYVNRELLGKDVLADSLQEFFDKYEYMGSEYRDNYNGLLRWRKKENVT